MDRLAPPWQVTRQYMEYVAAQAEKTQKMRHYGMSRVKDLADKLLAVSPHGRKRSVLSVGSRNAYELDALKTRGFDPVVGIDLSSDCAEVLPIDMHKTPFPSHSFDVIFSCHSLEHAYDVDAVLDEWLRLSTHAFPCIWAIEVPVNYKTCATDRHDFGSVAALEEAINDRANGTQTLWAEDVGTVARLVIAV